MKKSILVLDLGTTNIKGILYNTEGKQITLESYAIRTKTPSSDKSEQDPKEILQHVLSLIEHALTYDGGQLLAIGFSAAVQSFIGMDKNGFALTQNIIWSDRRSEAYSARLSEGPFGKRFFELTGNPIYPSLTGCKFKWFKENCASDFARLHKIVGIKEYVIFKLTGKWVMDYSMASATGLLDIHELKWSTEILDYFEMEENLLPQLKEVTHRVPMQNHRDFPFSLPYDIPIVLGASDGCLANLGAGAITTGKAALTIGTSGAVRVTVKKPFIDSRQRLFCYYLYENTYIVGGAANAGAAIYHWFLEAFGGHLDDLVGSQGVPETEEIRDLPIFLPYLNGERAPIWDAQAKGMFFGITAEHDKEDFGMAVLHGILYAMRNIAETLTENGLPIDRFMANGGFLQSRMIVQKLADVTNRDVVKSKEQGSAYGAFLLTLLSLGIITGLEDIHDFLPEGEIFGPKRKNIPIHDYAFQNFLRMQKAMVNV